MKNIIFLVLFFFFFSFSFSQETLFHLYRVPQALNFKVDKVPLNKIGQVMVKNLTSEEVKKISLKKYYVEKGYLSSFNLYDLSENKIVINKDNIGEVEIDTLFTKKAMKPDFIEKNDFNCLKYGGCRASVLFEKDSLFVNLFNFKSTNKYKDDKKKLFYKLKDGQTAELRFQEGTATTIIIPLKYRFGDDDENISEQFTTSFTASMFLGYTEGRTKFHYRKKIGNRTVTIKNTYGAFIGASTVELTASNTDNSDSAPQDSEKINVGAATVGIGYLKSLNKIAMGIFVGWDFAVGDVSNTWNYDGRAWLGFGIGYDIFKL